MVKTGEPFVTTPRQQAYIRQRHLRERFTVLRSRQSKLQRHGRYIHSRTVSRTLKRQRVWCRRPYKLLQFQPHHRRNRLQWARQKLNKLQNRIRVFRWVKIEC